MKNKDKTNCPRDNGMPGSSALKQIITSPSSVASMNDNCLLLFHGKATDALARMSSKYVDLDEKSGTGTVTANDVKLVLEDFKRYATRLGISTHKLLNVGVGFFTLLNHVARSEDENIITSVSFSLLKYAELCGVDVVEGPNVTKKQAKMNLDNFRKQVRADLNVLYKGGVSWTETVRKNKDFYNLHILEGIGIQNGQIRMDFTRNMARYLVNLPLTQTPKALWKVSGKQPNAYNIGLKMTEHFSIERNQTIGTADRLKVDVVLSYTSLPTYEQVKKIHGSWRDRIKEPLEAALDILTRQGVLADWKYIKAKGEELTELEASEIVDKDFGAYANLYIRFTLVDAPIVWKTVKKQ